MKLENSPFYCFPCLYSKPINFFIGINLKRLVHDTTWKNIHVEDVRSTLFNIPIRFPYPPKGKLLVWLNVVLMKTQSIGLKNIRNFLNGWKG